MTPRNDTAHVSPKAVWGGSPQLTLAHILVQIENFVRIFARPLLIAGLFLAISWLGIFAVLFPWLHLFALVLFITAFFESLGRAHVGWRPATESEGMRRVEEASGLQHRPLDVIGDRPVVMGADQMALWNTHTEQAKEKLQNLRWPSWKLDLSARDPYALRYAVMVLLAVGAVSGWGMLGGRVLMAINPALAKWHLATPALDAWITPPAYTHLPPIMIATPAGLRHENDVIDVPEGSVLSAHMAEKDGATPTLDLDAHSQDFVAEDQKDFAVSATLAKGESLTIRRGWQTLGSWRIRVISDKAPQIAFTDQPSVTERKSLRLPFEATDDYGVDAVTLRITPRESLPGISAEPVALPLATIDAKNVKRTSFVDLTPHPWAGMPVTMQLVATDRAGHKAVSDAVNFTLPERVFMHPLAAALIEERKKLLQSPFDDSVRNEAANIMAGIARQPDSYRGDPLVLMVLRSGAVRLVLDHGIDATTSVDDLLWQAAVRIEDGNMSTAEQKLRQAQQDLADALDRNDSERNIQRIIDRLHQALSQYMSELMSRTAARPGPAQELSQTAGTRTNMITPEDLDRMLNEMRQLSASGSRDAAREELSHLQQLLENLHTGPVQLSAEQRAALQRLRELRALAAEQQKLIDKTFQNAQAGNKKENHNLATEQNALLDRLHGLMKGMGDGSDKDLADGASAMGRADKALESGNGRYAVEHQSAALKALQQAERAMQDDLQQSLFMLPGAGSEGMVGNDPFGRRYGNLFHDDHSVTVPDQMQVRHVREILNELQRRAGDMNRPKTERDYIDRLLQNF